MEIFTKASEVPNYLAWRRQNPKGFVLNINTWSTKSRAINVIHSAERCPSLDKPPKANRDNPITPEHPKLCSTDIDELIGEMKSKNLPYKRCGNCLDRRTFSTHGNIQEIAKHA